MTDTAALVTTDRPDGVVVTNADHESLSGLLAELGQHLASGDPYAAWDAAHRLAMAAGSVADRTRPPFWCSSMAEHAARVAPSALNPNCSCHKTDGVRLVMRHELRCPEQGNYRG